MTALELLLNISGILEVPLYGAMLHVITDLDWDTDRLTSRSREAGLEVLSVRRIAVSSEDVFASLIRSEQAD